MAACGGGGGNGAVNPSNGGNGGGNGGGTTATVGLAYADPTGSGWRWVRNPALSSPTSLVLELQGPGPATLGRGVVFSLQAKASETGWVGPAAGGGSLVQNIAFNLGTGAPLVRTSVKDGLLQAGVFQKGQGNAIALGGALCRVDLTPGSGLVSGQALTLTAPVLQLFPDTGTVLAPQSVAVGTLTAQ